jgi:tetratricopeptide (TPR) repeat protein
MFDEETNYLYTANNYLNNSARFPAGSEAFNKQVSTLRDLFRWLSDPAKGKHLSLLSDLLVVYSPALEAGFNHTLTASLIEKCIDHATDTGRSAYELCLVAYRAFWAIGNWAKAEKYIRQAVDLSQGRSPVDQAGCLQILGSLQINKGDFREALVNLEKGTALYKKAGDKQGEINILKEKAAYYLDKGDFAAAERMYHEAGDFEFEARGKLSTHSLSMLGVVTRRQGKTVEALAYLEELQRQARLSGSRSEVALAMHHIAWAHLNQHKYELALKESNESQRLFREINDPRGESDCDEQIGEIYQAMGDYPQSRFHYECCANLRMLLDNKQGLASVSRRMARLYMRRHHYIKGSFYLFRCCVLYIRTGMLNKARLQRGIKEVFLRRNMASYPR